MFRNDELRKALAKAIDHLEHLDIDHPDYPDAVAALIDASRRANGCGGHADPNDVRRALKRDLPNRR
jgi:hypothetical protein